MNKKAERNWIIVGIVGSVAIVGGVITAVLRNKKKKAAQTAPAPSDASASDSASQIPTIAELKKATWKVGDKIFDPKSASIQPGPDGTILIGSGAQPYRGVMANAATLVTTHRKNSSGVFTKLATPLTWTIQSIGGFELA